MRLFLSLHFTFRFEISSFLCKNTSCPETQSSRAPIQPDFLFSWVPASPAESWRTALSRTAVLRPSLALEPNPWGWVTWPGPLCSAGWWSAMNGPPMTRTTAQTRRWHLSPASPPLQVLLPATPAVPAQVLSPVSPRVSEAQFAGMFISQKRRKAKG